MVSVYVVGAQLCSPRFGVSLLQQPGKEQPTVSALDLLVVPFFVASLVNLTTFPEFNVPTWAMWAHGVLGVIGGILARATMRLEKASVI